MIRRELEMLVAIKTEHLANKHLQYVHVKVMHIQMSYINRASFHIYLGLIHVTMYKGMRVL